MTLIFSSVSSEDESNVTVAAARICESASFSQTPFPLERWETVMLVALGIADGLAKGLDPTTQQRVNNSTNPINQERAYSPKDKHPANGEQRKGLMKDTLFIQRRSNRFEHEEASNPEDQK